MTGASLLLSRALLAELQQYQPTEGWTTPWCCPQGSGFSHDFQATVNKTVPYLNYNYRTQPDILAGGEIWAEAPGVSCFLRDSGEFFHFYSTWARGTDVLGSGAAGATGSLTVGDSARRRPRCRP